MHFWIDKRSQACGYNGRHRIPPSLSGPRRSQRLLCGGVHPKLMVTPVHRFQSIESVATGGLRHPRTSNYHARFPFVHSSLNYNASSNNVRSTSASVNHSLEVLSTRQTSTPVNAPTPKNTCKCQMWMLFSLGTFIVAGTKYYSNDEPPGVGEMVFVSIVTIICVVIFAIGAYEVLHDIITKRFNNNPPNNTQMVNDQQDEQVEENPVQVPNAIAPSALQIEMPPPPYHIAIMLPPQNEHDAINIIQDSPPPSYDKAVT